MIIYYILGVLLIITVSYPKIGRRIAERWYLPGIQTIAIDSMIDLGEKDLNDIGKMMIWWWPVLVPIEVFSDFVLFRFCY